MKVKELITLLERFDGELTVMVDGYEGGYQIPTAASVGVAHMYDDGADYDWEKEPPTFAAVLVSRSKCEKDSVRGYGGRYETNTVF
jgi:hypothetical protein